MVLHGRMSADRHQTDKMCMVCRFVQCITQCIIQAVVLIQSD
jgi:hypothetical protein